MPSCSSNRRWLPGDWLMQVCLAAGISLASAPLLLCAASSFGLAFELWKGSLHHTAIAP